MPKPSFEKATMRWIEHLPPASDMTLLVLKGHLLIEELVRQLIDKTLTKPESLKDARLETHQCICLAEALYYDQAPSWIWNALKKLNSIRNKLAHNLEPVGFEDKVVDFQKFVEEHRRRASPLREVANDHPVRLALGDVHFEIAFLRHYQNKNA